MNEAAPVAMIIILLKSSGLFSFNQETRKRRPGRPNPAGLQTPAHLATSQASSPLLAKSLLNTLAVCISNGRHTGALSKPCHGTGIRCQRRDQHFISARLGSSPSPTWYFSFQQMLTLVGRGQWQVVRYGLPTWDMWTELLALTAVGIRA